MNHSYLPLERDFNVKRRERPFAGLQRVIKGLAKTKKIKVLFLSTRPEYFSPFAITESNTDRYEFSCIYELRKLAECNERYDIAIVSNHIQSEHLTHWAIRDRQISDVIVSWTWDNHQNPATNITTINYADVVCPGHRFARKYLYSPYILQGIPVPLCTGQWSKEEASSFIIEHQSRKRSSSLSGRFFGWPGHQRSNIIQKLKSEIPFSAIELLDPSDRTYFELTPIERFRDWSRYKTSLILPLGEDVSCRLFDALITGQIPIIAGTVHDLDDIISPEMQRTLPILRLAAADPAAIRSALEMACASFDHDGAEGILRRHKFASENHHISNRLRTIVDYIVSCSLVVDPIVTRLGANGICSYLVP